MYDIVNKTNKYNIISIRLISIILYNFEYCLIEIIIITIMMIIVTSVIIV